MLDFIRYDDDNDIDYGKRIFMNFKIFIKRFRINSFANIKPWFDIKLIFPQFFTTNYSMKQLNYLNTLIQLIPFKLTRLLIYFFKRFVKKLLRQLYLLTQLIRTSQLCPHLREIQHICYH